MRGSLHEKGFNFRVKNRAATSVYFHSIILPVIVSIGLKDLKNAIIFYWSPMS